MAIVPVVVIGPPVKPVPVLREVKVPPEMVCVDKFPLASETTIRVPAPDKFPTCTTPVLAIDIRVVPVAPKSPVEVTPVLKLRFPFSLAIVRFVPF